MGLVRKNFLIVSSLIVATIVVLLGFISYAMPVYYNQVKQLELKKDYKAIVKKLNGQPREDILSNIRVYDDEYPNILLVLLTSANEEIYPKLSTEEVIRQSQHYMKKGDFDQIGHWSTTITSAEGEEYIVEAEYGFQSLSGISQVLMTLYPLIVLVILVLSSLVAYIYSRLSNKRITAISRTTRQMHLLEEGVACKVNGQDEIATLAQDVNLLYTKLLTSIGELKAENEKTAAHERQQADFLRMTAHELKTPIASVLGLVEGMIYNVGEFKNRDTYLKKCRGILQEQSQLVYSILEAANLDIGLEANQEQFDLKEQIKQHLEPYEALAKLNSYNFVVKLSPVTVTGIMPYLLKAIKNILDNAFRYTKEGGMISLSLTDDYLVLENQSEYLLSDVDLQHIFQPFYRPDSGRDRQDGGTGIGLYLVKQILEQHGFAYLFERDEDVMRFTIVLQK